MTRAARIALVMVLWNSGLLFAAETPPLASSVTVYIKLEIKKEYGFLARIAGNRNNTLISKPYDIMNNWWDNPLVVYRDPPLSPLAPTGPEITGGADTDAIKGVGTSRNVVVTLALIPHAEVAIATAAGCDAMKGTITLRIRAAASYFDRRWTPMIDMVEKTATFTIDTLDPKRPAEPIGHDVRTIPVWSFERYTRDHEKWEPRSAWPTTPKSGDWRVALDGTGLTLDITAYRYKED